VLCRVTFTGAAQRRRRRGHAGRGRLSSSILGGGRRRGGAAHAEQDGALMRPLSAMLGVAPLLPPLTTFSVCNNLAPCAHSSDLTNSTPSPGECSGQRACQHAQLGIPETAHGPTLEHHQLPHGSSTHALTRPAGYTGDELTARHWNTTSCLTAAPLTHSQVRSMFRLLSEKAVDYEALATHVGPAATTTTRPRRGTADSHFNSSSDEGGGGARGGARAHAAASDRCGVGAHLDGFF
jgi:hypothetical protein